MPDPTAAAPWTVTLAWTPDQNFGAVSALNGRVALHAIFGLLRAGESHETVAAEYGLTVQEVAVLDRLRQEFADDPLGAASREPVDLDTLIGWVEQALESSAIEVDVWETDLAGSRAALSVEPLRRLTRCLRSAGLLDEYYDGESPTDPATVPNAWGLGRAETPSGGDVRAARTVRGWSVRELSERAAVAPMTVQRIEKGQNVRPASRRKIAAAFDAAPAPLARAGRAPSDDDLTALLDRWVPPATIGQVRDIIRGLLAAVDEEQGRTPPREWHA